MEKTLANILDRRNGATNCADPDLLIVHRPRGIDFFPWDDHAKRLLDWLAANHWSVHREPDAIVAVTPWRPEIVQ